MKVGGFYPSRLKQSGRRSRFMSSLSRDMTCGDHMTVCLFGRSGVRMPNTQPIFRPNMFTLDWPAKLSKKPPDMAIRIRDVRQIESGLAKSVVSGLSNKTSRAAYINSPWEAMSVSSNDCILMGNRLPATKIVSVLCNASKLQWTGICSMFCSSVVFKCYFWFSHVHTDTFLNLIAAFWKLMWMAISTSYFFARAQRSEHCR